MVVRRRGSHIWLKFQNYALLVLQKEEYASKAPSLASTYIYINNNNGVFTSILYVLIYIQNKCKLFTDHVEFYG
jgi:hypothetical protein